MRWIKTSRESEELKDAGSILIKKAGHPDIRVCWELYVTKWRKLFKPWVSDHVYTYAFESQRPLIGGVDYIALDLSDDLGASFLLGDWLENNGVEFDEIEGVA